MFANYFFAACQKNLPPIQYFIDTNNDEVYDSLVESPELDYIIPKDDFSKKLRHSIQYPAIAKGMGISGIVTLDVLFNEQGRISSMNVKNSVSKECDLVFKISLEKAARNGYSILKINSKPVKYRIEISLDFWLE